MTPYERARANFDAYAAMPAGELPADRMSALQVQLARWEARNFGAATDAQMALGIAEESGELATAMLQLVMIQGEVGRISHATLKSSQGIRGYDDREKVRADVADAGADLAVYLIQLLTALRIDFGTILRETAGQVMARDWKAAPGDGGAG